MSEIRECCLKCHWTGGTCRRLRVKGFYRHNVEYHPLVFDTPPPIICLLLFDPVWFFTVGAWVSVFSSSYPLSSHLWEKIDPTCPQSSFSSLSFVGWALKKWEINYLNIPYLTLKWCDHIRIGVCFILKQSYCIKKCIWTSHRSWNIENKICSS